MNFRILSRVCLSAVIFAGMMICGVGSRANGAPAPFTASLNIVFDDGRVMFYKGSQAGIAVGDIYALSQGGETIAKIEIDQADLMYSTGKVITATQELREGGKYDFSPATSEELQAGATAVKKAPGALKTETAQEQPAGEEKKPEVKELAKTSVRRKKVEIEEEKAAPAANEEEANKEAAAPQADQSRRTPRSEAKTGPKEENKPATKGQAKKEKEKEAAKAAKEEEQGMPGLPSTLALAGSGLTGMIVLPTTQTLPANHARLGLNYLSLHGSDVVPIVGGGFANIDSKFRTNTISFGYGISENTEIAMSEDKNSDRMDVTSGAGTFAESISSKTTAFSAKYRFDGISLGADAKKSTNINFAVLASMANEKDREANNTKYVLYGLAAGVQVAANAKVNALYGSQKASETGFTSHSEKFVGVGLDYQANEEFKVLAEYLKESRYAKYKSLGVQYQFDEKINFDAAYQIYSEDVTDFTTLTVKGFLLGANYVF